MLARIRPTLAPLLVQYPAIISLSAAELNPKIPTQTLDFLREIWYYRSIISGALTACPNGYLKIGGDALKTLFAALLFALTSLALAQDEIVSDRLPARPILITEDAPILIRVIDNQWGKQCANLSYNNQSLNLYQDRQLIALIAEMLSRRGLPLAKETAEILNEANQRRALEGEEYVDKSSPIFVKGSIKPGVKILEITTGGTSDSKRSGVGVRLGQYQVSGTTESGSSIAFIAGSLVDRTSFNTVGTIVGRSKYSSTNIESFDFSRSRWFSSAVLGYAQQANHEFRRGLVSTGRALVDFENKLDSLLTTRKGRGG